MPRQTRSAAGTTRAERSGHEARERPRRKLSARECLPAPAREEEQADAENEQSSPAEELRVSVRLDERDPPRAELPLKRGRGDDDPGVTKAGGQRGRQRSKDERLVDTASIHALNGIAKDSLRQGDLTHNLVYVTLRLM